MHWLDAVWTHDRFQPLTTCRLGQKYSSGPCKTLITSPPVRTLRHEEISTSQHMTSPTRASSSLTAPNWLAAFFRGCGASRRQYTSEYTPKSSASRLSDQENRHTSHTPLNIIGAYLASFTSNNIAHGRLHSFHRLRGGRAAKHVSPNTKIAI